MLGAVVGVAAIVPSTARATTLTVGGFESGDLTGWTPSGDVQVYQTFTLDGLSIPAPQGSFFAVLATENDGLVPGPGATLSQTVTARAGDVITGQAKWFGTDPGYDIGTVTVDNGGTPTVLFAADASTPQTPWTVWTYTAPADGVYTITAHVANTLDDEVSSYLGIDAVGVVALARGGYCSVKGNTYPFTGAAIPPGTFLDLTGGQVANDATYKGAVPANYLQGLGITCDVLPGYVKTGETVGYFGHGDPGMYTYYAKAG